jgi:hypothetical protein
MRARLAAAAAIVVAAGAVAAGARFLPDGADRLGGPGPQQSPVPLVRGAAAVVCPGPETLISPAGGESSAPGGPVRLRALAAALDPLSPRGAVDAPGVPVPNRPGVAASVRGLAGTGAGDGGQQDAGHSASSLALHGPPGGVAIADQLLRHAGATRLDANPGGDLPPRLAAVQTTVATSGEARGLVATGCATAASDLWLVGGSTVTGHRARLQIANPMSSPAVVDLTVHGPGGRVNAPGGDGIVVPASGQVALFVDAIAPGLASLAVHVHTRSGRVTATLFDSVLRGLVAGGDDDVPVAAPPATTQVVPGLAIQGSATPSGPDAPGATAVRVVVPGTVEGIVRVSLLGPTGVTELGSRGVVTVPGGAAADVLVSGVPDGVYAAVVRSDVPVVAGAVVGRASEGSETAGTAADPSGSAPPADFGWASATLPLTAPAVAALPGSGPASAGGTSGSASRLVSTVTLAAPGAGGKVLVQALDASGSPGSARTLTVPAGGTLALAAGDAAGVLIEPVSGGRVHAAIVIGAADARGRMVSVIPMSATPSGPGVLPIAVEDQRLGLGG